MEEIVYQGATYYLQNGLLFDEQFLELPSVLSAKILGEYFGKIDYTDFTERELLDHIVKLKRSSNFIKCLEAIEYGADKYCESVNFFNVIFPIVTSCYRSIGQPRQAIYFYMANKSIYRSCLSTPLLTSLAAAYCDVGEYDNAKKCADMAYAKQGGGKGYTTELSLVYRRIKSETGE